MLRLILNCLLHVNIWFIILQLINIILHILIESVYCVHSCSFKFFQKSRLGCNPQFLSIRVSEASSKSSIWDWYSRYFSLDIICVITRARINTIMNASSIDRHRMINNDPREKRVQFDRQRLEQSRQRVSRRESPILRRSSSLDVYVHGECGARDACCTTEKSLST